MQKKFWSDGIYFKCQGSGQCCTTHGEFGFVFLTLNDRKKMAEHLKITTTAFTKKYCEKKNGFYHLIERADNPDCIFLKNKRCTVYQARPTQCRTWPFWPEVLNPKAWKKEIVQFCPGAGKNKFWSAEEIEKQRADQMQSEKELQQEAFSAQKRFNKNSRLKHGSTKL